MTSSQRVILPVFIVALMVFYAAGPAPAAVRTEVVKYQHGDVQLQGYLAYDDAVSAPQPGVLVVHEWWGLNAYTKMRVEKLAGLGYVAFALDMYGDGKTTDDPQVAQQCSGRFHGDVEALRARAQVGLEVLTSNSRVDKQRVAAIGYCFGGTTALELAYSGAPIQGVATFHAGPAIPRPQDFPNIKARLLICHGADDPMIPAQRMDLMVQTLKSAGADWQLIYYSRAKHSFTNPGADARGMEGLSYNADADRRSWQHMLQFFDEMFGNE